MLRRWAGRARRAENLSLGELREQRLQAREQRWQIDRFLHVADGRLALPALGSNAMQVPMFTEWSHRPDLWRGRLANAGLVAVPSKTNLGRDTTVFHDATLADMSLRQNRNRSEDDLAPFGGLIDVYRFDGSFLSLSIDLPEDAVEGVSKRHVVRLDCVLEAERYCEVSARLSVQHGPNREQIVRNLPDCRGEVSVEFDLAYANLDELRVQKMWIDLIFSTVQMNRIGVRDLFVSRRPRAEI